MEPKTIPPNVFQKQATGNNNASHLEVATVIWSPVMVIQAM